jgi:transcriptional regulator with XRE-family HTH domain
MTSYGKFIKQLRERQGFSHDDMIEKLREKIKISKSSYYAIERGEKKLTLAEATELSKIFDVTIENLLSGSLPNDSKYRQMILAFLREAKLSKEKLKKTKLAKLLYFADFAWFYQYSESMSGMSYRKIDYGPVPDAYFRIFAEMEEEGVIDVDQKKDDERIMYEISETILSERENLDKLSSNEKKLIKSIWRKWEGANTRQVVKFTHEQAPYKNTDYGHIIPYD